MSSKLKSLQRRNLVLAGIAVLLGAWVLFRSEPTTSARKEALPFAFPDFARDDARRVELSRAAKGEEPAKRLILQMGAANKWHMESHARYPLQAGAGRLLDAIGSARLRSVVTGRQETFDTYAGTDGWHDVNVVDSRGRTLVRFGLGRYRYPNTFLRLGEGEKQRIVRVTTLVPNMATLDVKSWIDTRVWPGLTASKMIRIDVQQTRDKRTLTVVRRGEKPADVEMEVPAKDPDGKKEYWLAAPKQGDAKTLAVEDLAREFTGMLIHDIVAGAVTPADEVRYGFGEPELVATFFQKEGEGVTKHTLTVGRKVEGEEQWYVRREGATWVFTISGATSIDRMRQGPEEFLEPEPEKDDTDGKGDAQDDGDAKDDGSAKDDGDTKDEGDSKDEDQPDRPDDPGDPDGDPDDK